MLKSSRLEDHMKNTGIDRSSFNMSTFEHRCINNTTKIYQHAGKCDDQQNLKDVLEAAPLSTPQGFTYNSPNVHMPSTPVFLKSSRKSLCLFTNILDVKPKTAKRRFVAAKYRRKAMKVGITFENKNQNGLQK